MRIISMKKEFCASIKIYKIYSKFGLFIVIFYLSLWILFGQLYTLNEQLK